MLARLTVVPFLFASLAAAAEPARPNIVLFLVDDLGARDLSCYGSDFYETPHIDALAAGGVRFAHAYAAYPRCVPSRQAILSGKYPTRFDVARQTTQSKHALPLEETTFGEAFQDAGYRTCYIGKWHLGKEGGGPGEQGFDDVIHSGSAGATGRYFAPFETEKDHFVDNPVTGKADDDGESDGEESDYLTDRLTDAAADWITQREESDDQPFLLVMAHYAVHTPIEAPAAITKRYQRKLRKAGQAVGGKRDDADLIIDRNGRVKTKQNNPTYAAMVERTDASLGRLVDALAANGELDRTAIILTSDHGGLSTRSLDNRRQLATSNAPFRQGKGSVLEGGLRVPHIVSWPGHIEAGLVSEVQTLGTDHYPTMLAIAGLPLRPDQHADGVSYLPSLRGEPQPRPAMFWNKWMARTDSTGDDRAIALTEGPLKLIEWLDETDDSKRFALYDLVADPGERANLAADQPGRLDTLKRRLHATEAAIGDLRQAGRDYLKRRRQRQTSKTK